MHQKATLMTVIIPKDAFMSPESTQIIKVAYQMLSVFEDGSNWDLLRPAQNRDLLNTRGLCLLLTYW